MTTSSLDAALLEVDLYLLLDPSRALSSASPSSDVSRAYRKQARLLHPDKNPDQADAAASFDRLQRAYELLSDEQRRAEYDERWKKKEERKRKREAEDSELQRLRQRLQQREAEAQQSKAAAAAHSHRRHAELHQRLIHRENEAVIAQLQAATQSQPTPPPRPPPSSSSSAPSATVILSLVQPAEAAVLRSYFARYGGVEHAMVRQGGLKAFVTFYHTDSAEAARRGERGESRRWTLAAALAQKDGAPVQHENQRGGGPEDERKDSHPTARPAAVTPVELKAYESATLAKLREMARKKKEEPATQPQSSSDAQQPTLHHEAEQAAPPASGSTAAGAIEVDV